MRGGTATHRPIATDERGVEACCWSLTILCPRYSSRARGGSCEYPGHRSCHRTDLAHERLTRGRAVSKQKMWSRISSMLSREKLVPILCTEGYDVKSRNCLCSEI